MAFIDVPGNDNSALQSSGRVNRMGQDRMCHFYIITTDVPMTRLFKRPHVG